MKKKKVKEIGITALYERLSRDDDGDGDSNSIVHQKQMLEAYAKEHGFVNLRHYTDDGWSGASFDRPAWNELVAGVKAEEITTVIVKDLSRVGRDHLQVGFFTDILFREKEVHFIAIGNGIDSNDQQSSEFAPFLNIMNEWYVRDRKAIKLSLMGIPIGLLLGWPIGRLLLPAIVNMLTDDIRIVTTVNPLIFLVAIVFSAITVFISCQKPAILAAKVSPMEALHYIEQTGGKKKQRRSKHISTMMMAKNNLTRNKKKVMIVTLSFALSIVLLNSVYTYVTSFDFDKFVADFSLTDFTVSDTTVINNYAPYNTANVSQDFISQAESLNGLEDIGNIYLWTSKQPLSENDLARLQELSACSSDIANELENYRVRQEHGVNVYGLDDFPAEYVQVLDGELNTEQWKAGTGVYVTPLRMMGDGSLCLYKPGDQISVTQLDGTNKVYDVLAVVSIPSALQTPLQVDMGLDYIFPTNELLGNMVSADQPAMKTIFNVDEEHQLATENWLKNYTTNTDTALDYLSKVTLRQTFDGMINMYRLVGGALCAILALIGILNFINSMTTSILSRYGEIAMLQSVGMTGRQVKQMLIYEGIGYSILGLLGSLILSVIASLTVVRMMGAELTYFTWHFTLIPVFLCIIPLILITAIVPLVCYNKMAQKTVVERLRLAE